MAKRRWLLRTVIVLALLAAACGVAVVWFVQSESALRLAAQWVANATGGKLRIEDPTGSLAGAGRFRRIVYEDADVRIVLEDVEVVWSPMTLASGRVLIHRVAARAVEVAILPTPDPATLPDSLALPSAIEVESIRARTLALEDAGRRFELADVDLAYAYAGSTHRVTGLTATSGIGRLDFTGTIGVAKPFPVTGSGRLEGNRDVHDATVDGTLAGDLAQLEARLKGAARGATIGARLVLEPYGAHPLRSISGSLDGFDLAAFLPGAPQTALAGSLDATMGTDGVLSGPLALKNARAGPVSAERIPVAALEAVARTDFDWIQLDKLTADLGAAGRAGGTARIAGGKVELALDVRPLNLQGLHANLRRTALTGRIDATVTDDGQRVVARLAERGLRFDLVAERRGDDVLVERFEARAGPGTLAAKGSLGLAGAQAFKAEARFDAVDPSALGDFPRASLNGTFDLRGRLAPAWAADVSFILTDSRLRQATLTGNGTLHASAAGVRDANVDLRVGANTLRATGSFGAPDGALALALDAPRLAEIEPRFAGRLKATGALTGTPERPAGSVDATGEALRFNGYAVRSLRANGSLSADADRRLEIVAAGQGIDVPQLKLDRVSVEARGSVGDHAIQVQARGGDLDLDVRAAGGGSANAWRGRVTALENRGRYPVALIEPATLEAAGDRVTLGEARVRVLTGTADIRRAEWDGKRLLTAGSIDKLPFAPLAALAAFPLAPATDLALDGEWSIDASPRLNGFVRIRRDSGDIVLGARTPLALELKTLTLDATFIDDVVQATGAATTVQLGDAKIEARLTPPPSAPPGTIGADARLEGTLRADLPSLQVLEPFVGTAALVSGQANAELKLGGTVRAPVATGTAAASGIRVEIPQYGVALRDGMLRATLASDRIAIDGGIAAAAGGRFTLDGAIARDGSDARLTWQADKLWIMSRPNRRLVATGSGSVAVANEKLVVRGLLSADEGYVEFDEPQVARLGNDVVIVGQKPRPPRPSGPARARPLDLDVTLDAGDKLRIVGSGLEADLRGRVRLTTDAAGHIIAKGEIQTERGIFNAFGHRLEVVRGRLIFDGPVDNPALDVVALRRNQQVEAGIELTGTVNAPRVRLVSEPPVPDAEKLAWLTLGRGLDNASSADLALLQSTALVLVDRNESVPLNRRLARELGLDDIGLRGSGALGNQVISVGKRLSDQVYLEFEQGLTAAYNLVRLNFALTRAVRLRVEAGQSTGGFGISYGRSFD